MWAPGFSETSVPIYQITPRHSTEADDQAYIRRKNRNFNAMFILTKSNIQPFTSK
jgi:hypothetical protein